MTWTRLLFAAAFVDLAVAQSGAYAQCGGKTWTGATACVTGYHCEVINEYYYQCVPGAATGTAGTTATSTASATRATATATNASPTGSGTNPGPTLVSGWYYVRAVASPNFHSYLQTKPTGVPSDSFLDAASDAGQFNIVDGQLVYNTGAGGELYMHVENPADKTQRKLETWFAEAENDYGAFAFQGDTLTWHVDEIARPNEAAWLVCEDQQLFINTGAYAYQTPEGCADQTIHSYGGSTPNV